MLNAHSQKGRLKIQLICSLGKSSQLMVNAQSAVDGPVLGWDSRHTFSAFRIC